VFRISYSEDSRLKKILRIKRFDVSMSDIHYGKHNNWETL
jgi:hypothetical protein